MQGKKLIITILVTALSVTALPYHAAAKTLKIKNVGSEKIMPLYSDLFLETNIKAWKLRFTSSDEDVAEVTEEGRIKANMPGKTTIRIKQKGSKKKAYKIHLTVRKPNGYTISETGHNFRTPREIALKAAKGYTVYYTTNSKFRTSQKIKSGKTKKITFSYTTLLQVYAVKNSRKKKVTKAFLNRKGKSDRNCGGYYYWYIPPCGTDLLIQSGRYPMVTPSPEPTAAPSGQPESTVVPSESPEQAVIPSGQPESTVVPLELPEPIVIPSGQSESIESLSK